MKISRVFHVPNKWTFSIKPIMKLIKRYMADTEPWADPFAGMYSPAHIRNDVNPERNAEYNLDALEFLKTLDKENVAGVLFDPPFSSNQLRTTYADTFKMDIQDPTGREYRHKCKKEINRIVIPGGHIISLGWDTNGCSVYREKSKHFARLEKIEILIVAHGAASNDTLVTVEQKIQEVL